MPSKALFRNDPYSMLRNRVWIGEGCQPGAEPAVEPATAAKPCDAPLNVDADVDAPVHDVATAYAEYDAEAEAAYAAAAAAAAVPTEPLRAPVRTMQHLLQNVPYLFLDAVADSTAQCHAHQHRVGQGVSAWSGRRAPEPDMAIRDVFVAQLPFDLPLGALQQLADLLVEGAPVEIFHAAPHVRKGKAYDGCAFVKMSESDARRFIDALHKRVLFDVDGVWVATTPEEIREMTDYCAWMQEQRQEQRREILKLPTPFSAMTAEFALRSSARFGGHPHQHEAGAAAAGYMAMPPPRYTHSRGPQQQHHARGGSHFAGNMNAFRTHNTGGGAAAY
jgi:hypothetical protein